MHSINKKSNFTLITSNFKTLGNVKRHSVPIWCMKGKKGKEKC